VARTTLQARPTLACCAPAAAQLDTGDVTRGVPHYELTIAGGASDLSIERR
jgi:hypothetical protein